MKLSGTGSVKMFRFSCFHAHINGHKPKKTIQASAEAMHKTSEDYSLIQLAKSNTNHTTLNELFSESHGEAQLGNDSKNISSFSSAERSWKSDEVKGKYILESDAGDHHSGLLKKSKSLGNVFFLENRNLDCDGTEDELDRGNSCDDLGGKRGFTFQVGIEDHQGISPPSLCHDLPSDSLRVSSGLVNYESNSSPQDLGNFDNVSHWNSGSPLSNENIRESGNHTARAAPVLVKALSLPSISSHSSVSGENSPLKYLAPYSKSSVDLHGFGTRKNDSSVNENDRLVLDQGGHDGTATAARNSHEIVADDADDSYNYVGSAKDWIVPVTHEISLDKSYRGDLSTSQWDKIPGEDFKTKRIQEWVMDLQHCGPLEEADELSFPDDDDANKGFAILDGLNAIKLDSKTNPGMEAAKRYISSLNPTATTAQLANHGLVVIPFLSAFVSLKVLNLSGNAIVRITSGALPRGLHMLNLSKNNISTIEGLRELTRLRILDLSYNRIIRIGHGLASCSSLKELYLAGNKISEVEGLHRLLKLNVLDLRFNKISTAKCLGQLAANFNSLQAISLEGNPSQKNVGDEQLKKYLQGLLPHLAYYNRQPIKSSKLKDASDRSVRLGISERCLRSDPKLARKGGHGKGSHKPLSSSVHSRKNQAVVSPKLSKGRHARLPPSVPKAATNQCHQHFDFGSKLLDMKVDLLMRKSRSEGTLGVA